MKASPTQVGSAMGAADSGIRLFLLYGPDQATAQHLASLLGQAMGADAERVDIDGGTLRGDPARLADEAASLSLFGGGRYIRVTGAGDESADAFAALLATERPGNPVVAINPALKATSKLVKLALGARNAMACACYVPDGRNAELLAAEIAREQGLRTTGRTAARLVESTGGDRAILAREVEKVALYLDAAPDRPRDLDDAALDAIGADLGEGALFDAIAAAVEGRVADLGRELALLEADGASMVPLLRQLARRLMSLAEGGDTGRPGPDQAELARAARRWSPAMIATAIDRVRAAERAIMASASAGDVVAAAAALTVGRAAARHR